MNEAHLHLTAASNRALAHLDALALAASKVRLNIGNAETGLPPKDPLRVPTNWWSAQDQAFAGMATGALLDEVEITGTLVLAWLQQQLEAAP